MHGRRIAGTRAAGQEQDTGGRTAGRGRRVGWAPIVSVALAALGLAGCDDTQPCFPTGARCDQSAMFSEFFQPNVPCCQGTCTQVPRPPTIPSGNYFVCQ